MKKVFKVSIVLIMLILQSIYASSSKSITNDNTIVKLKSELNLLRAQLEDVKSDYIFEKELRLDLTNKIDDIQREYNLEDKVNKKIESGLSLQIAESTRTLTVFAVLFGVITILISLFVSNMAKKIKDIKKDVFAARDEVVELNTNIHKDITGLYEKIKREETVNMLDRLVLVPKDITNLSGTLLSRTLENEDYNKLIKAYNSLPYTDNQDKLRTRSKYHNNYRVILYQNFFYKILIDKAMRNEFKPYFEALVSSSFESDMIKSVSDFTNAMLKIGMDKFIEEIGLFWGSIGVSQFKDNTDLYKITYKELATKRNRLHFYSILKRQTHLNYIEQQYLEVLNERNITIK